MERNNFRLTRKGELAVDAAKRIADSSDPVKLTAALIDYQRVLSKMLSENKRVK